MIATLQVTDADMASASRDQLTLMLETAVNDYKDLICSKRYEKAQEVWLKAVAISGCLDGFRES